MLCPLGAARILHPIYPIFSMPIMIFLLCKIVREPDNPVTHIPYFLCPSRNAFSVPRLYVTCIFSGALAVLDFSIPISWNVYHPFQCRQFSRVLAVWALHFSTDWKWCVHHVFNVCVYSGLFLDSYDCFAFLAGPESGRYFLYHWDAWSVPPR